MVATLLLHSCGTLTVPTRLAGTWESDKHKITVRTSPAMMKFEFVSDSASTRLIINNDKSVNGNIGMAEINKGKIKTNWLLPTSMTGVAYIIKCDLNGNIFETDPLETKKVEFWVPPLLQENMDAELRYTQGGAQFPMAEIIFYRAEE